MRMIDACKVQQVTLIFYLLPFPSGWTTSSAKAVHQLRPNVQPRHNQRLGKSISGSYELERMHNLHRINPSTE